MHLWFWQILSTCSLQEDQFTFLKVPRVSTCFPVAWPAQSVTRCGDFCSSDRQELKSQCTSTRTSLIKSEDEHFCLWLRALCGACSVNLLCVLGHVQITVWCTCWVALPKRLDQFVLKPTVCAHPSSPPQLHFVATSWAYCSLPPSPSPSAIFLPSLGRRSAWPEICPLPAASPLTCLVLLVFKRQLWAKKINETLPLNMGRDAGALFTGRTSWWWTLRHCDEPVERASLWLEQKSHLALPGPLVARI